MATSAAGAVVTFAASATDAVSTPTIAYSQNPGTTFPLGTTIVTVSATDASNNVQTGTFNVTVNPVVASITLTTPSYTYDGTAKAATATTAPAGLPVTFTYDNGPAAPVAAGAHTVAAQVSLPWILGSAPGTLIIAKANPSITVAAYGVTYDATAHTAVGSATGVQGESLAGLDVSATSHVNAGNYADSWTFKDSTSNYNNASGQLNDSIATAALAVAAAPQSKVYGSADPLLGFSVTGGSLFGADSFSGSLLRAAGENVGTYPITQGTLSAGSNYTLSFSGSALTITKATAAIHLGSLTQTYGGVIEDASVVTDPANLTVLWSYNQLPLAFKPSDGTLAAYAPAVGQTIYVNVTGAAGGAPGWTGGAAAPRVVSAGAARRSRRCRGRFGREVMRQELGDGMIGRRRQLRKQPAQVRLRLDLVQPAGREDRVKDRGLFSGFRRANEQPGASPHRHRADIAFRWI